MADCCISNEESYMERRQLFKHVWHNTRESNYNEDISPKSKVIKTCKLEELPKVVDKKKKRHEKNLKTVCKKILNACGKNEGDEIYEQMAADDNEAPQRIKKRKGRLKKRAKQVSSMLTRSDRKHYNTVGMRHTSPIKQVNDGTEEMGEICKVEKPQSPKISNDNRHRRPKAKTRNSLDDNKTKPLFVKGKINKTSKNMLLLKKNK